MKTMKDNRVMRIPILVMLVFALCVTSVMMLGFPVTAGAAEGGTGTEFDPYIVTTEAELTAALASGGSAYIQLGADMTLATDCKLTVPEGASLTVPEGMTLTAQGGVENNGSIVVNGTIVLPDTMSKTEVLALGTTGTGSLKFGDIRIRADGNCISHQYENGLCTVCRYSDTPAEDSDSDGYLEIDSAAKLWWFTQQVNGGNRNLNAELTANIDLAGTCGEGIGNWQPIGNKYSGHFNGQGFTISNLYITGNELYVGLFGSVRGATIENVTVTGSVSSTMIYDESYNFAAAGGIVAYMDNGTIRNCHVDMTVNSANDIGGICGTMYRGLIEDCTVIGNVICNALPDQGSGFCIGGIVGCQYGGTVRGCVNRATASAENSVYFGGIAGLGTGDAIENCLNYGTFNAIYDSTYAGGTVAGGIVGSGMTVIRGCGNLGLINISGSGEWTGGIVGIHQTSSSIVENCCNVGSITSSDGKFGVIVGTAANGAIDTNCYYLSDTTTEDGGRTAEQFASGQVAYELNGSTTTDESVWKQTLGTDSYPTLAGDNVYYVTSKKCDGTVIGQIYSNSSKDVIVHEDTDDDSFCDLCEWLIITEITFPDANFRSYIAENIDTDGDGLLSPEEITAVTSINVHGKGISDLSGIKYFTELTELDLTNNNLTSIDISALSELTILSVYNNTKLASLNLSGNPALEQLNISFCTSLRSLNLSNNINLMSLEAAGSVLTSLDLSHSGAGLVYGSYSSLYIEHCGVGYVNMNLLGDVSRMEITSGGTMGEDGWLLLDPNAADDYGYIGIKYNYDTGNGYDELPVEICVHHDDFSHTYVANTTSKDATHHYTQWCETCRTGNEESVVAHTIKYDYTTKYTDSQHREYCKDCDYLITEACNYASDCEENCSECRLTTRVFSWEEHTLIYTTYIDGDDDSSNDWHGVRCANCSSLNNASERCYYEFACSETCVCGRANPTAVAHTEIITTESDGTHDKVCSVCAAVIAENIGHNLTYTASGNVLTETCALDGCSHSVTATIIAPANAVYNGAHNEATVTYSEGWCGGELTVTYSGTANDGTAYTDVPVNAGNVTASITLGGAMANLTYTVAKANNEWIQYPAIQGWEYGDFGNEPTAKAKFGEMDFSSFSYRLKGTVAWTNNPPTEVGIYEMRARVQATDNWELLETTIEFKIDKTSPTANLFTLTPPANHDVCDGLAKEATVTVKDDVFGVGAVTAVKYFNGETELNGAPMTVGTYTVKIDVAEGSDYRAIEDLTIGTFTVDTPNNNAHKGLMLKSNDDGTHDKCCTVCEKVISDAEECSYQRYIKSSMLKSSANCTSPEIYYMSCACGQTNGETFEDGYTDPNVHVSETTELSSNNDGTHNVVHSCCKAVKTENAACTPPDCTKIGLCDCGYRVEATHTEHDFSGAYSYNDEYHWKKCKNCDVTGERDYHYGQNSGDCTKPTLCGCGYVVLEAKEHSSIAMFYTDDYHYEGCLICTMPVDDVRTPHDFSISDSNEYDHWNKCSGCDKESEYIPHSGDNGGDCTKDSICSCGYVTKVAETSHSFTVAQSDKNQHWNKCATCEETDTKADHTDSDSNHECDICDAWLTPFEKVSLSLGDDLAVNYFIAKGNFTDPQIRFTINGYTKTVDGVPQNEQFKFVFDGVAPQWIGDTITAELIVDGTVIETKEYSVLRYLNSLKSKTAAELGYTTEKYDAMITLINDLLIYGGAAQTYTGHKTDALVSEGITGSTFEEVTTTDVSGDPVGKVVTFNGMNVYFNHTNRLVFRFSSADLTGVTFTVKVNDGEEKEIEYAASGEYYIIMTDAIKAIAFDDAYTITAYKDGEVDATLTYSVKSYVYSKQGGADSLAELAKATYNYGQSAKAFAGAY